MYDMIITLFVCDIHVIQKHIIYKYTFYNIYIYINIYDNNIIIYIYINYTIYIACYAIFMNTRRNITKLTSELCIYLHLCTI